MNARNSRPLGPALIAGTAGGVLSGLPFISCVCCLWIIGAGILAAYLSTRKAPEPAAAGEGAVIGAWTGVVAAAVVSIVSLPLAPLNTAFAGRFLQRMAEYVPEMPAGWEQWIQPGTRTFSLWGFFLGLLINAALFAGLAALGGIIGMNLFAKRPEAPVSPPVPPQPGSPS
jgi:hypothetical protein